MCWGTLVAAEFLAGTTGIGFVENVAKKWSNSTPYVFAALNYLERQQIEGQINVSCKRGKVVNNQLVPLQDPFSVFDKIPGTPRYWLQRRYEVLARVEQLGPFQLFFTLSCADKRWIENFTSYRCIKGDCSSQGGQLILREWRQLIVAVS